MQLLLMHLSEPMKTPPKAPEKAPEHPPKEPTHPEKGKPFIFSRVTRLLSGRAPAEPAKTPPKAPEYPPKVPDHEPHKPVHLPKSRVKRSSFDLHIDCLDNSEPVKTPPKTPYHPPAKPTYPPKGSIVSWKLASNIY